MPNTNSAISREAPSVQCIARVLVAIADKNIYFILRYYEGRLVKHPSVKVFRVETELLNRRHFIYNTYRFLWSLYVQNLQNTFVKYKTSIQGNFKSRALLLVYTAVRENTCHIFRIEFHFRRCKKLTFQSEIR